MTKNIFKTKISDLIYVKRNYLDKKLCNKIIKEYEPGDKTYISSREIINRRNSFQRKEIDMQLSKIIQSSMKIYLRDIWEDITFSQTQGFCLNKMNKGDRNIETNYNWKTILIYLLNDDFQGGNFCVQGVDQKLKQGDLIMFPSCWMFPYEVKKITKGSRYNLITGTW